MVKNPEELALEEKKRYEVFSWDDFGKFLSNKDYSCFQKSVESFIKAVMSSYRLTEEDSVHKIERELCIYKIGKYES